MARSGRHKGAQAQAKKGGADHPLLQGLAEVQGAERLRLAGKLKQARAACAAVLEKDPDYVAALFTMGLILADQAQYDEALRHMHRAMMFNPLDPQILTGLSGVYLKLGSNLMAARTLEQARQRSPEDANILVTLGEIYREEKEYELSKEAFEAAFKIDPSLKIAEKGIALNMLHIGELAEACEILERQVREGGQTLDLFYHLSQLPVSMVGFDLVSMLERVKPAGQGVANEEFRSQLAFTKAAALDKAGKHEKAWTQVCEARRHNADKNRKAYQRHRPRLDPLLKLARTAPVSIYGDGETASEDPVSLFIAGPSRSGKTSLERLVGSLEGVKKGYENPIVENAVARAFQTAGLATRSSLVQLPPGLGDQFREFYREELEKRAQSARVLTNTLPARIEDAVRAAMEIPNARFVFIKRDIDDLSIRIFMRNYATGNYYASDLRDIREFVTWSHQMMDAAAERMPEITRVLSYEDMVADPAAALAEVVELCGLEMPSSEFPGIGDDRGCSEPYRGRIQEMLRADS